VSPDESLGNFNNLVKRALLPISVIFSLFLSGCAGELNDSGPTSMDAAAPAVDSASAPPTADTPWPTIVPSTADFDYYIFALSWAPDYCSANPDDAQECSPGRKYAFVLHGLWPEYTKGYPSTCGSDPLPASVKAQFPRLYPNDKLFEHEWSKHGTCSGLSPVAYLTLARQFKDQVQVPTAYRAPASPFRVAADDLKQAFLEANPALIDAGLAVNCSGSGRFLSELYICFSKEGQPAACGADVRKSALKSCANPDFLVRSVR
jgi:ribonuclease T2